MKKLLCLICVLTVFSFCKKSIGQQMPFPVIGMISEREIFLDHSIPVFKKKKIAEVSFSDPSQQKASKTFHPDTMFYGIEKNGQLKYMASQNVLYWKDSISFEGYDTTHLGKDCKQSFYYDCIPHTWYDSIECYDEEGRIKFMRQHFNLYINNSYYANGLLKEQAISDRSPDGSQHYKAFYTYDQNNRLTRIDYASLDLLPDKHELGYPISFRKTFSYNSSGLLSFTIDYQLKKDTKKFIAFQQTDYVYKNGLVSRIDYKDKSSIYILSENVNYKFY